MSELIDKEAPFDNPTLLYLFLNQYSKNMHPYTHDCKNHSNIIQNRKYLVSARGLFCPYCLSKQTKIRIPTVLYNELKEKYLKYMMFKYTVLDFYEKDNDEYNEIIKNFFDTIDEELYEKNILL